VVGGSRKRNRSTGFSEAVQRVASPSAGEYIEVGRLAGGAARRIGAVLARGKRSSASQRVAEAPYPSPKKTISFLYHQARSLCGALGRHSRSACSTTSMTMKILKRFIFLF
jgi:hypothetical protein